MHFLKLGHCHHFRSEGDINVIYIYIRGVMLKKYDVSYFYYLK